MSAAETAASFASLLYTETNPGEAEQVAPFSTLEIERRMMAALPAGWKAEQMAAQHPNATYESFNRAQIAETARPKNMPYNMAACDSSQSSYASGRLDFQPYFAGVDIERADCEDTVLDVAFGQWWREAALVYRLGDPTEVPDHGWDWPDHPVADLNAEANANDSKLRNGSTTLRQIYADAGNDFDDALPQMAKDYGVTVDEMRKILRLAVFNGTNQLGSMEQAAAQRDVAETQAETQIEVSQSTPINAEGSCVKWIRIGARETKDGERKGGFAACLDSDGTITRGGPKALRNKHVSDVGKTFKRMANSPAAHKAKYDRQVEQRAKSYGVSVEEYQQVEKDAIDEAKRYHDEREAAKKYARKITGLSQADVNRLENQGYDYSSGRAETKGLDVSAVEVARQYPGLGIDPEGDDVDAQVWELIREGDKPFPAKASDEYHRIVDDYIQHMSRSSGGGSSDYLSDIDPSTMEFEAKRKAGDV